MSEKRNMKSGESVFFSFCFFVTFLNFYCYFVFQLEIIDACVNYIEKLQSQLLVKPTFEAEDEDDVDDDEGIDEGDLEHQQQQQTSSTRLTCSEQEDCNGNLEKWSVIFSLYFLYICDMDILTNKINNTLLC